ncbi:hypothetical protein BRE01_51080 [Brevibacillus reuszeri]|uniref:Uncharacterized protein n=1 Tax=Brevibacillus reuszeri TaxID=54915 RepID=A0ABQ0TU74_9BACL|nr:hypothetical protein BRE01_51080 [Brevibacillus reuszeri]
MDGFHHGIATSDYFHRVTWRKNGGIIPEPDGQAVPFLSVRPTRPLPDQGKFIVCHLKRSFTA